MQPFLWRILCADDDTSTTEFMELWLTQQGYEVQTANTRAEALQLAQEAHFDLYILDDWFSDGDGKELIQPLRAIDPLTPIIIISGDVRDVNQEEALCLGAQAFLHKPLDFDKAADHIAQLICAAEQIHPPPLLPPTVSQWHI